MTESEETKGATAEVSTSADGPSAEDRPRSGPPSDRGGDRGGDRGPSRGAWTVKSRLRAASRKKARKAKKKSMFQRRKVCRFCADKTAVLDYKEAKTQLIHFYLLKLNGSLSLHQLI